MAAHSSPLEYAPIHNGYSLCAAVTKSQHTHQQLVNDGCTLISTGLCATGSAQGIKLIHKKNGRGLCVCMCVRVRECVGQCVLVWVRVGVGVGIGVGVIVNVNVG